MEPMVLLKENGHIFDVGGHAGRGFRTMSRGSPKSYQILGGATIYRAGRANISDAMGTLCVLTTVGFRCLEEFKADTRNHTVAFETPGHHRPERLRVRRLILQCRPLFHGFKNQYLP